MSVKRVKYNSVICAYFGEIKQNPAKTPSPDRMLTLGHLIKSDLRVKNLTSTNTRSDHPREQAELSDAQTLNCAAFTPLNNLGGR